MTGLTDADQHDQSTATAADPSLTLAAKRLAGSTQCLNCGTELKGPFCYYCGQPDRNFMRFFPALLRDLMEDLLDLDSRFMRTLKPLLFKPGRLTRDFMNGRRFRYTTPMRLYIFSSITFFLLAALLSDDAISVHGTDKQAEHASITQSLSDEDQEQLKKLGEILGKLPLDAQTQAEIAQAIAEEDDEPLLDKNDFSVNDEPWDRETNPVKITWLPDRINDWINDEIEESPGKAKLLDENPSLIVDKIFDILPATMFILLPFVALIFKFWYLFAKRYYVEHLIFSLHNHAFIFTSLVLLLLISKAGDLLHGMEYTTVETGINWLKAAIWIWIPIYLLISLRVVYQQNWLLTVGKFFVIGISYMTLLTLVSAGVAITSFVLL